MRRGFPGLAGCIIHAGQPPHPEYTNAHEQSSRRVAVVTQLSGEQPRASWGARSLSVFVAAYNEVDNLAPTVNTIQRALDGAIADYEIIVVDDGSTDGTRQVADALATADARVRVIHYTTNRGLGYGWLRAIEAATKQSFVFVPGDNTWPHPSLRDIFSSIGRAEVITSYTTNPEIRVPARRVLSDVYTTGLNVLFGLKLEYYHGLTIYPIEFLRSNAITTYGFASMAEALLRAIHHGLSVVAVPCAIEERATGHSKAVSLRSLRSVVGTIGRLFIDLRLRGRRGPHATLALFGSGRHAAPIVPTASPVSAPSPSQTPGS